MSPSNIAPPGSVAKVSIINTCFLCEIPIENFMQPVVPGHEQLNVPSYAFFIENDRGRRVLFDLGLRKDWQSLAPSVLAGIESIQVRVVLEDDVVDSLKREGIQPRSIEAVVLSHHHWDHIGNPSLFPDQTAIVVGPGFTKEFIPGYPANKNSLLLEKDYSGKVIHELDFGAQDKVVNIGSYRGIDYFGDGSFYLLDAPGHSVGHICGLARTTRDPDTFVFLGADACHHNGEFRPSQALPLPGTIHPDPFKRPGVASCPCDVFERWLSGVGRTRETSFFETPSSADSTVYCHNLAASTMTIKSMQSLDSDDNVFVILAHDDSIRGLVDFFPASVNHWKERGWKENGMWAFLKDFRELAKSG